MMVERAGALGKYAAAALPRLRSGLSSERLPDVDMASAGSDLQPVKGGAGPGASFVLRHGIPEGAVGTSAWPKSAFVPGSLPGKKNREARTIIEHSDDDGPGQYHRHVTPLCQSAR